jgi:hypothetical protein
LAYAYRETNYSGDCVALQAGSYRNVQAFGSAMTA